MSDEENRDHEVGYCKPPKRSQFKPGQSGNPKGRPKGVKNFRTELEEALALPVTVTHGKKKKIVSTAKAILLRIREKALGGDLRASDRLFVYANLHVEQASDADHQVDADDEAVLAEYGAKIRAEVEASLAAQVTEPRAPRRPLVAQSEAAEAAQVSEPPAPSEPPVAQSKAAEVAQAAKPSVLRARPVRPK